MMSSRWPRPIGTIASMALMPVCTGWLTDLRQITPGATFDDVGFLRVHRALAVDWLPECIHDTANQRRADGHREDAARCT